MQLELVIRFDYGAIVPWVQSEGGVLRAVGGPDALALWSPVEVHGENLTTRASFTVEEGQCLPFTLAWYPSHEALPKPLDAVSVTEATRHWWEEWAARCSYQGPWREAVLRSLITLKSLTFAPTGGMVAAATTSLPERIGGVRNWDYRYCWIRDATFSLYALMVGGYTEEAAAWRRWLLRTVAGDPASLQILYGPFGERRLPEQIVESLPGYEGSRPVRIGNAAVQQRQLDIFGELMDVMHLARRSGVERDPELWDLQKLLVDYLAGIWKEPDEGIWEVRGPRRDFTHSKVMAWVAVDRAVKAVERFGRTGPVEAWRRLRAEIHEDVCQRGFDRATNTFTQYDGAPEVDASLLMLPLVGFLPATDPRVLGTVSAVERSLMASGLVRRYRTAREHESVDGLPPGEGVFLPCSFWLADNYALQGRRDEAERLFERLLSLRNHVGLLSEEYDPRDRRLLGNFPQAFSHVSLINTARNLAQPHGPAEHRRNNHGAEP